MREDEIRDHLAHLAISVEICRKRLHPNQTEERKILEEVVGALKMLSDPPAPSNLEEAKRILSSIRSRVKK